MFIFFCVRMFKFSLNTFHLYNTVATLLYVRTSDLIHLTAESLCPFTNSSLFPHPIAVVHVCTCKRACLSWDFLVCTSKRNICIAAGPVPEGRYRTQLSSPLKTNDDGRCLALLLVRWRCTFMHMHYGNQETQDLLECYLETGCNVQKGKDL